MNNFENHSLAVLEDALARGWENTGSDGDGPGPDNDPETRLVDAIWRGLSRLDRV
ncbi:hypothetical protein DM2_1695 [Halorubrum sp. DM2]|nr:hypothetical protein DM2_1695 [Halorubrum sp. DM2]